MSIIISIQCRWFKSWSIDIDSERKQRTLMKADLEKIAIKAESVPFLFNTKHGAQELRPAPLAYATDLKCLIFHLLDEKDRFNNNTVYT